MGHFAKVIDQTVITVNSATQEWVDSQPDKDMWLETSYNIYGGVYYDSETGMPHEDQTLATATAGRRRKNYAGIGYRYDSERDAFIPPTPFPSWVLNEDTCLWEPPIPYPDDSVRMGGSKQYVWDEYNKQFIYNGYYVKDGELHKE